MSRRYIFTGTHVTIRSALIILISLSAALQLLTVSCSDDSSPSAPGGGSADCIDYGGDQRIAGNCDTPGNAGGVVVSGDYVYVGDSEQGLTTALRQCD